jgi:hypothetical protein
MSTIANAFFKVLEFFDQHRWAGPVLALIVGVILGLIFARLFVDVELVNTTPASLRSELRGDYLLWVSRNYESESLADPEWARHKLLGADYADAKRSKKIQRDIDQLSTALEELAQACDRPEVTHCSAEDGTRLRNLSADVKNISPASSKPTLLSSIMPVCLVLFIVLALLGLLFIAFRWWRGRQEEREVRESIAERVRPVEPITAWGVEGAPLAQFPTTYALGDDHFDPSFSIELENGEFMGECGVGISETLGVGTPSKVTAFEVWLFDKSDIRTVTKVVMSEYAFGDEALRAKLAPKGEPMLAQDGAEVMLETKTLRVRARVVEAEYGIGNLPQNSFFERLSIDLAAWVKPASESDDEEFLPEESSYDLSQI